MTSNIEVVETRHGPVISGDPAAGTAISLRSTQFAVIDKSFDCLVPMLKATGLNDFYEATRGWGLIDHNLVAADTAGHIGHRVRALVPKRPRSNGWLPVPGWTGEHEWQGMVPFEDMPCQIDPPDGMIVTANNRVVAETGKHYMSTDAMPPHRARRISTRLSRLTKATVEDMPAIHRDLYSIPGTELRERLRSVSATGEAEKLRKLILAWDGQMSADFEGRRGVRRAARRADPAGAAALAPATRCRQRLSESVARRASAEPDLVDHPAADAGQRSHPAQGRDLGGFARASAQRSCREATDRSVGRDASPDR